MVLHFRCFQRDAAGSGRAFPAAALLLLVGMAFGAPGATAQPPASGLGVPEFYIETLTVEGLTFTSEEIILSESLLEGGQVYTEGRLRNAIHRINRLPFVLDAQFSLKKGSVRDRYELVITVVETRRWFFSIEAFRRYLDDDSFNFDAYDQRLVVGRRHFVGKSGVLFAVLGNDADDLTLGYSHYDLFGRSILFNAAYSRQLSESSLERNAQSLSLGLGIPLATNQSLQISGSYFQADADDDFPEPLVETFFDFGRSTRWSLETAWNFNSLDDPVLPTTGLLIDLGLLYSESETDLDLVDRTQSPPLRQDRNSISDDLRLRLSVQRFWSVSPRQSLSLGSSGSSGVHRFNRPFSTVPDQGREESDVWTLGAELGHSLFLLRSRTAGRWRELRWESNLGYVDSGSGGSGVRLSATDNDETTLGSGLVYRNGWGVFRFNLSYVWNDAVTFP